MIIPVEIYTTFGMTIISGIIILAFYIAFNLYRNADSDTQYTVTYIALFFAVFSLINALAYLQLHF